MEAIFLHLLPNFLQRSFLLDVQILDLRFELLPILRHLYWVSFKYAKSQLTLNESLGKFQAILRASEEALDIKKCTLGVRCPLALSGDGTMHDTCIISELVSKLRTAA